MVACAGILAAAVCVLKLLIFLCFGVEKSLAGAWARQTEDSTRGRRAVVLQASSWQGRRTAWKKSSWALQGPAVAVAGEATCRGHADQRGQVEGLKAELEWLLPGKVWCCWSSRKLCKGR